MNSEVTPAAATLTKTPHTSLYPSSRQVYARLQYKQGKARLTSDPQPSRAKLAPIRAATDIANPTISTPAIASNRQTTAGLNPKMPDDHRNSALKPAGAGLSQCVPLPMLPYVTIIHLPHLPVTVGVPQTVRIAQDHGKHLAQLRHRETAMGFEGVHQNGPL